MDELTKNACTETVLTALAHLGSELGESDPAEVPDLVERAVQGENIVRTAAKSPSDHARLVMIKNIALAVSQAVTQARSERANAERAAADETK